MKMEYFIVIIIFLHFPAACIAKDYFGFIQYHDVNSGATYIVFQSSDSKALCKALNKNFWTGVRTSCPQCNLELSGCDTELPSAYRDIFKNQPLVVPYVSAPYTRIAIFGVSLGEAKTLCRIIAQNWEKRIGQPTNFIYE